MCEYKLYLSLASTQQKQWLQKYQTPGVFIFTLNN